MNYPETLDYLYNTLPMFSRLGSAAFKKDLTNIVILCEKLGNPQTKFKTIHVGGTNGKGSVSHMLAAVYQTAGYRTGLYTSPHLYDFRERIRVNGAMVEKDFVVSFTERLRTAIEEVQPSFFEITVAMAFEWFVQQKVEIAVIEVGLGGRLDSTNIILPELSVITNIGWDHMNLLGNTLEEIALEKAGIIKPGVPVVIGERTERTDHVFQSVAAQKNAPLYFAEDRFTIEDYQLSLKTITVSVTDKLTGTRLAYQSDLAGIYQTKNMLTVLQAIQVLNGWTISEPDIRSALRNVRPATGLQGRWEVIHKNPTVVLEVAHNKEGIGQMLLHLDKISYNKLHIVFGMVKDKDIEMILRLLPKAADYYFTRAQIPRALDALELGQKAVAQGLKGKIYDEVNKALQAALNAAGKDDLIVVCGSIFLVAEVDRNLVQKTTRVS
jgi:dihydrofolate synthase/folylpolyglutamate synthase